MSNCGYNALKNSEDYPQALPQGYRLLDMYVVGRVLGQGGYGITYLGIEKNTGEKIAIKEYFPRETAQRDYETNCIESISIKDREYFEKGKGNFLQEARVLAKFAGIPNIVEIRGCFEENNTAYIIMEYIEGITFQQYITQRGGKIPWKDACEKLMPVISEITDADGNIVYEVADIGSCMDLQVIIPDTYKGKPVVSIQKYAFCDDDFEEIIIPDSIYFIDERAFYECTKLKEIVIPSSVTDMHHWAFLGSAITTIYCEADSQPVGWEEDWNAVDSIDKANVIWGYHE